MKAVCDICVAPDDRLAPPPPLDGGVAEQLVPIEVFKLIGDALVGLFAGGMLCFSLIECLDRFSVTPMWAGDVAACWPGSAEGGAATMCEAAPVALGGYGCASGCSDDGFRCGNDVANGCSSCGLVPAGMAAAGGRRGDDKKPRRVADGGGG